MQEEKACKYSYNRKCLTANATEVRYQLRVCMCTVHIANNSAVAFKICLTAYDFV